MPLLLWIQLIACNVIWAMNPALGKVLIQEIGPAGAAWIRYFGALAAYLLVAVLYPLFLGKKGRWAGTIFLKTSAFKDFGTIFLIGCSTFFFSPLTQMLGLSHSTALNNSLLVALEPVFTVLFSWLLLKERLTRVQVGAFLVAFMGFVLLSRMLSEELSFGASVGDLALAISTAGEGLYAVLAKKLLDRHRPSAVFGTALALGVLLLTAVVFSFTGIPALGHLSFRGLFAAFWIGPIGTTATYFFWLWVLQKGVAIGDMALTLFVQPVVGALLGYFVLKESMTVFQAFGGALILLAVVAQEYRWGSRRYEVG
jgi:drug/metabolite transporter (DMT)-like permease